jgi:hypothetical protein
VDIVARLDVAGITPPFFKPHGQKQQQQVTLMPQFYFNRYVNGRWLPNDRSGCQFTSEQDARTWALWRTPALLRKTLRAATTDIYLATEVSDGERTLCIVRGKLLIHEP